MRCSLLVLSSYLDEELSPERTGEVDAHMIGCGRCSTALGYLREESERIGGLAQVRVPEHAAQQLFAELRLIEIDEELPGEVMVRTAAPTTAETPPWIGGAESGKTLPWAARHPMRDAPQPPPVPVAAPMPIAEARLEHDVQEEAMQSRTTPHVQPELSMDHVAQPDIDDEAEVELAGFAMQPETPVLPSQPIAHVPLPSQPIAHIAVPPQPPAHVAAPPQPIAHVAPPQPVERTPLPPQPATHTVGSGFMHRIRDAVALRFALMRGAGNEFDDNVEIVTSTEVPRRSEQTATRRAMPPTIIESDAALTTESPRRTATAVADAPYRAIEERLRNSGVFPAVEDQPLAPAEPARKPQRAPAEPGRHLRSLGIGERVRRPAWMNLSAITQRAHSVSMGGPAVGVPERDRKLWVFGAAVAVLLLIGLMVGKSVSSLPLAGVQPGTSQPSAAPSAPAAQTSVPTTAPTAAPTPRPTPPPVPSAAQLTGAHTLGSGATGFQALNLRYGVPHAGDLRVVFDLGSAGATVSGEPRVIIGFGNATTLYVEFVGVLPAGSTPNPLPGNTVVSAHLLAPGTIPGRTIYQFDLAHAANFSAYYLAGPVRLVIDLTS